MLTINGTCNATLDEMRIGPSEHPIVGSMTFHTLALIIAAACALIASIVSFYLIIMHATHYTKPYEQRHIIRILFMIPVYAASSFLQLWFYWHAVYFHVISDCYEAFAIASFFALLCHYIAPNLHEQKQYFRTIPPKGWVLPISWFKKCCGGERGCWRTPRSGLTWFNIIWTGIYQYCFIRVAMTVTAVITQYFGKYCESSNSPVFAHIWILVIEASAVTIAMYCVIQFYYQLRDDLAPHRPFLKVAAIKLVIFLSFWQTFLISILTSSTLGVLHPTDSIAYPDLKVGIPALLICIEMTIFAFLHLFAFPWQPYGKSSKVSSYPLASSGMDEPQPKQGGFMGIKAFVDAMNPWDLVKAFARGMRWLIVGVKHRENDASYKPSSLDGMSDPGNDMALGTQDPYKRNDNLPIANEFRRSKYGMPGVDSQHPVEGEEGAGLIAHAQPNPLNHSSGYVPARQRYDVNGQEISHERTHYDNPYAQDPNPDRLPSHAAPDTMYQSQDIGMAIGEPEPYQSHVVQNPYAPPQSGSQAYLEKKRQERQQQQRPRPSEQWANSSQPLEEAQDPGPEVHNALWGSGAAGPGAPAGQRPNQF